ncbi:XRE family transcriptional regulator [Streptomyces sp. NPDC059010]|uniref:XRE family transcriptional regulator n=1 Tax=Streptomyces sp. NPDC059010 TaxID=3346695 RepID=UPI00368F30FA
MSDAEKRSPLADGLERLFDEIRPEGPRGRRYTNEEVAAAIKQDSAGIRVSGAYLSALRNGTKRNPSMDLRTALARFFAVPVTYFLEDTPPEQAEVDIALAKVGRHPEVKSLALRALELGPEGLAAVSQIVEYVLSKDQTRNPADADDS